MKNTDTLLNASIQQAELARSTGNHPFGAVIAKGFEVIAAEYNKVSDLNDPTAHAEILAIRSACQKLETRDLTGYTLYSTCEPCSMCIGAIYWSGLDGVIYGAQDPENGGIEARKNLLESVGTKYVENKECDELLKQAKLLQKQR